MITIVGAGLAGLACATRLEEAGVNWLLLEASDQPGGRVATDVTPEGFRLDRGFQVLLDSYPTARRLLDLPALNPCFFESGALLAGKRGLERFLNPLRNPGSLFHALGSRSFSLCEKITLGIFASSQVIRSDVSLLGEVTNRTSMEELNSLGLGGDVLEKFLRPFFAGVFLDNELGTDSSVLRYDLKKFALGRALLPARGMGEIPGQLSCRLPASRQRYGTTVTSIEREKGRVVAVLLASGERIECEALVLASDERSSRSLLGLRPETGRTWSEVTTLYFTGEKPLYEGAMLVLPEGKERQVRHFADLTNTAPEYAPPGHRLLSATVLNPVEGVPGDLVARRAQAEISELMPGFSEWRFLKEVRVRHALPSQSPGFESLQLDRRQNTNLWLAGDQVARASIETALSSGLQAADEVVALCRK